MVESAQKVLIVKNEGLTLKGTPFDGLRLLWEMTC
jgi:hypothetical protein